MSERKLLHIENAEIVLKNFTGEEHIDRQTGKVVNTRGTRTFGVIIEDPEMAQQMAEDGWNIKILSPNEDHPEPKHFLPVEARYRNKDGSLKSPKFQPKVTRYCGRRVDELTEDTIHELDEQRITKCELVIGSNEWDPGRLKAFLNEMCVACEPRSSFRSKWDQEFGVDDGLDGEPELPF